MARESENSYGPGSLERRKFLQAVSVPAAVALVAPALIRASDAQAGILPNQGPYERIYMDRGFKGRNAGIEVSRLTASLAEEGHIVVVNYVDVKIPTAEQVAAAEAANAYTNREASVAQSQMLQRKLAEFANEIQSRSLPSGARARKIVQLDVVAFDDQGPVYGEDFIAAYNHNGLQRGRPLDPSNPILPYAAASVDSNPGDGLAGSATRFDFSVARDGLSRNLVDAQASAISIVLKESIDRHAIISLK